MKRTLQQFAFAAVMAGFAVAKRIPFLRQAVNRYEAAFQGWGERSWLFGALQDAWLEIDAMTRQELQRIHDNLIENSTIVQKIRKLCIQFSVGPAGLKVIPESSDEGFNDARTVSWEQWWARPELGSNISGAQLTRVWAGLLFDKGEIFVHKVSAPQAPEGKKAGRIIPKLQTIDAHRVKTPSGLKEDPRTGFPIIDGIVVNPKTGAPMAYFVKRANFSTFISGTQNVTEEEFDRLEAANVIHKFHMLRPSQKRGLPKGVSAFNLVRDNMDLHKMEMQAAKLASSIGPIETNPSGELSTLTNRRQLLKLQTQNGAGTAVVKNGSVDYAVTVGAQKIALKVGSKLEDFLIRRPTVATQDYWDLHYTLICMGYNVPKLLVMPYSLQGTVTRADLDVCANAFREDYELIRELLEEVYQWQSEWDLSYNTEFSGERWAKKLEGRGSRAEAAEGRSHKAECLKNLRARAEHSRWVQDSIAPDDAHVCLIRPPRAPNVDIGYTAKALEIEMRLGVKVPQDVFADKNQDWRQQVWQMGEFVQYVNQVAAQLKVEPNQLSSLLVQQASKDSDKPANGEPESSLENRQHAEVEA